MDHGPWTVVHAHGFLSETIFSNMDFSTKLGFSKTDLLQYRFYQNRMFPNRIVPNLVFAKPFTLMILAVFPQTKGACGLSGVLTYLQ